MNQCDILRQHLRNHGHITQLEAISLYRVYNLKGRINDLRNKGVGINTTMKTDATGKTYARYTLALADEAREVAAA